MTPTSPNAWGSSGVPLNAPGRLGEMSRRNLRSSSQPNSAVAPAANSLATRPKRRLLRTKKHKAVEDQE